MYEYVERLKGPGVVEFYTPTPQQGHRIVTIYLDCPDNPRIYAFNECGDKRTPAILYKKEIDELIVRAKILLCIDV